MGIRAVMASYRAGSSRCATVNCVDMYPGAIEQSSRPVDEDLLGGFGLMGFVGSFDELAVDEHRAGADEGDEMRCVDRAPAVLRGLDELECHREPGRA